MAHIIGTSGNDEIVGAEDPDILEGRAGDDILEGGDGDDVLKGGGGADVLDGGAGADDMQGGGGNDTYIVDDEGDVITDTSGYDTVVTTLSTYTLAAGLENLIFTGTGNWVGIGNSGANEIIGGVSEYGGAYNVFDGRGGADTYVAGLSGADIFIVSDSRTVIVAAVVEGTADNYIYASVDYTLAEGINVAWFNGDDSGLRLTGNSLWQWIQTGAGDDILDGGGGWDVLNGGPGDDIYYLRSGDEVIEDYDWGYDTVRVMDDNLTMPGSVEKAELLGGVISFTGNYEDNLIIGNDGDNILNGLVGADTLKGGAGNDTYIDDNLDALPDTLQDLSGYDTVRTNRDLYTLGAGIEALILTSATASSGVGNSLGNTITGSGADNVLDGLNGADLLYGAGGSDQLFGGAGADLLDGGTGADTMDGGLGSDTYIVDNAGDAVVEAAGAGQDEVRTSLSSYVLATNVERLVYTGSGSFTGAGNTGHNTITAGGGADDLSGGNGNDTLIGGAGQDSLSGGAGADRLWGYEDADTLSGGAGADVFAYRYEHESGVGAGLRDVITDFDGADLIDLHAIWVWGYPGFAFIDTAAFSGTQAELRQETDAEGTHLYGDTNGDGVADMEILLTNSWVLTAGDLLI